MFRLEATSKPRLRRSENIPEITSSQEQEQSSLTLRGGRAIVIVTVISPTTSFVFSTTTRKFGQCWPASLSAGRVHRLLNLIIVEPNSTCSPITWTILARHQNSQVYNSVTSHCYYVRKIK